MPWRTAEPDQSQPPQEESWFSRLWDVFWELLAPFDVFEIIFGFFRVVAHVIGAIIHGIFHL